MMMMACCVFRWKEENVAIAKNATFCNGFWRVTGRQACVDPTHLTE
jgi:hypothetical protein